MTANAIWEQVAQLPREEQVALARRILGPVIEHADGRITRPVDEIIGLASGPSPAPDDDEVKRWIHEHRMQKYGQ